MNAENIRKIREFNRSYTRVLKLTDKYHLDTQYTLLESRLLLEIDRGVNSANQLMLLLHVDKGYLSRTLKKLKSEGLLIEVPNDQDKRIKNLNLTNDGEKVLKMIDQRADTQVETLFSSIPTEELETVIRDMQEIKNAVKKYSHDKEM